jgi:hypothetical protein
VLNPVPPTHRQSTDASKQNVPDYELLDFDSVGVSSWQLDNKVDTTTDTKHTKDTEVNSAPGVVQLHTSTAVLVSNNMGAASDEYVGKMRIDFDAWGYTLEKELVMYRLEPSNEGEDKPTVRREVGLVKGPVAYVDLVMAPAEVVAFEFMPFK